MILTKLWERYICKEIIKVFSLFLFCFYFLYSLVDYSIHFQNFLADLTLKYTDILLYYAFQFFKRSSLLIPLAMLIATIKVLCQMNGRGELVALRASGISLKTLLRPFFLIAIGCALFSYFNFQWIAPNSMKFLAEFQERHLASQVKKEGDPSIQGIFLQDGSKFVYQKHDKKRGTYFDAYWIKSRDEIWRIKLLVAHQGEAPVGHAVDRLIRNQEGEFQKTTSYTSYRFDTLFPDSQMSQLSHHTLEAQAMTKLVPLLFLDHPEKTEAQTQLLFKLLTPLLSFIVLIGIAPFCVHHTRSLPTFAIYALGLFAFIAFYTSIDATMILCGNLVISPWVGMPSLFLIIGVLLTPRFYRLIR